MYRFIENIGDFFNPGYYNEDFINKVFEIYGKTDTAAKAVKDLNGRFTKLRTEYYKVKGRIKDLRLHRKYIIKETHDFNSLVMEALGYDTSPAYANWINVDDSSVIPARSILYSGSKPSLVVLEMQAMIKTNDEDVPAGLFEQHYDDEVSEKVVREQQYRFNQWASVIGHELPEGCKISPSKINECVSAIFLLPEDQRPKYIVIFAGNIVFLMEQDKWDRGSYLKFDLEELFTEVSVAANKNYYALFYLLAAKEVLAKDGEIVLMDRIADESFKNAYEVTKDLKEGVINAVERLANEAIYYKRNILQEEFDETQESFAANVKDDCLSIIYRLLFIFYAEARPEIGILPMDDEAYAKGYSLEILRDLEQTPLKSKSAQDSYFFHDSLWQLFSLISKGYNDNSSSHRSFTVKRIDSPLFNDDKFKALKGVKYRNKVWQEIICDLSLSREQARKRRGRISYANLGVNQLGSVYESLLAYRGFYAEEDYIEVHPVGDTVETYLVPRSRMGDFNDDEILRDKNGETVILKKGSFVYRLNGRDRKKSASYYTPEVLTKSTVKYTLLGFKEKLDKGEMKVEELLNMKILEPAMGAAAFQNEVINQIAEMYLTYRQQELNKRIPPQDYQDERQKVKAYIATKNIYGVDLNPTAIELGKLALWLNVMHKDMETPFFAHRLALGNAVIGAWFKAYDVDEIYKKGKRLNTYECTSWWEKAPHRLHFSKERKKILRKSSEIYHFLLPDKNMLAALQIREEKIAHPEAARAMQAKKNNWTRAITAEDVLILKKISGKIDRLISECIAYQEKIEKLTGNNYKVWGHNSYVNAALFSYLDKEAVTNTRLATTSAYRKLVAVMDYWCALWFWEYEDTEKLPTREEFWIDIENILGVDLSTGVIKRDDDVLQLTSPQEPDLFNQDLFAQESRPATEEEQLEYVEDYVANAPEPKYTKEDAEKMILSASGHGTLFTTPRSDIVQRLSDRYHFFHPMLEFIEVFWLRDGFDVIVGNPPWVKLQFNEQGIISDTNPEVVIRSTSAPEIREKIQEFLKNETLSSLYYSELQETTCSSAFLNAPQNYSLLAGQQTNLYKCVLTNCFDTASDNGYIGLLHPDGVYDDSHGQVLRKEIYHRLVYHFQYVNVLKLFAEILHWVKYSTNVYGRRKESICFKSISNLYHPATVDGCFVHDGSGQCGGLKDNDDNWNTSAHKDRIVNYSDNELGLLSKTFEEDTTYDEAKLVCIQANSIINILSKIADFPTHVSDFGFKISSGFHETGSVDKGILKPKTSYGNPEEYGMVFKGPQFSICTPWYKNPNEHCKNQHDYSVVRLTDISPSFYTRSNFSPVLPIKEYRELIDGLPISVDQQGKDVYDSWIDHYKLAFRSQLSQPQERTLICAVLPRKTAHINAVISVIFPNGNYCVDMAGLCSSLVLDFYIKTTGAGGLFPSRMQSFPIGVASKYKAALYSRVLRLNCLTEHYVDLWEECYLESFKQQSWSINDTRLSPFNSLSPAWDISVPLRNSFERRLGLVEIDVIVAMALGLSLEDLCFIYSIQFPVLQQNENGTWYDRNGNIVYTCSKGLPGIGIEKSIWEQIRDQKEGETYIHTIDPAKSELYGGQQVTYYAPYTKCDRIEDYRRAWAHFEKVFSEKK